MRTFALFIFLLCLAQVAWSQNHKNNWIFGDFGISFDTGEPQVIPSGKIPFYVEPYISMSDKQTGELLFYTNSRQIRDKDHQIVLDNFEANIYSHEMIVVNDPANPNGYYLIAIGLSNKALKAGLIYYHLTVTKDEVKADAIAQPFATGYFKNLVAVRNCRNNGFWIITFEEDLDEFHAYSLGKTGFNSTPVATKFPYTDQFISKMQSNHDGTKLVISEETNISDFGYDGLALMDIDKQCGSLTNYTRILKATQYRKVEGMCFSPNDELLYVSYFNPTGNRGYLFQIDLTTRGYYELANFERAIIDLETGPDDKIYLIKQYERGEIAFIDKIEQPDSNRLLCGYEPNALKLGKVQWEGYEFPNFLQDDSEESCDLIYPNFSINDACIGDRFHFKRNGNFNLTDSFYWMLEGNKTALLYPSYPAEEAGSYNFTFHWKTCGHWDSINFKRKAQELYSVDLGADTSICQGSKFLLKAVSFRGADFDWDHDPQLNDSFALITEGGKYKVTVRLGGCSFSDERTIRGIPSAAKALLEQYRFCHNDRYVEQLNVLDSTKVYNWYPTGDSTQWLTVQQKGEEIFVVDDYLGCPPGELAVDVYCPVSIYFPNAFSPNGDEYNPLFMPVGQNVQAYEFEIYNRWGELVFRTDNLEEGWDGTFKGGECPTGPYFWRCAYQGQEGNIIKNYLRSGTVHLMGF